MRWTFSVVVLVGMSQSLQAGHPVHTGNFCKPTYAAVHHHTAYAPAVHKVIEYVPKVQVILQPVGVPVYVPYNQPIALQSSAVYSYTKVSDITPGLDYQAMLDLSNRTASDALALAREVSQNSQALASQHLSAQKEIAQTLAAGQVVREAFDSVAKLQREQAIAAATPRADGGGPPGTLGVREAYTDPNALLSAKCASCHKEKYRDWSKLSEEAQRLVFERVNHPDPALRMPRAEGGNSEGHPLSLTEKLLLIPPKR